MINNVSLSAMHSNKMLPPNCLKRFDIDVSVNFCFQFVTYVLPSLFLMTIGFFSMSIILRPLCHNQIVMPPNFEKVQGA